jgi:hypothetical protein
MDYDEHPGNGRKQMNQLNNRTIFRLGPGVLLAGFLVLLTLALGGRSTSAPGYSQEAPGPLSKAHAALEGAANCQKCHGEDNAIIAERCLSCHAPVAARVAAKKGVHREVTGDCQVCHIEHQGVDTDLRPLDPKDFDHRTETGFPLEGKHAALAGKCPACHTSRSYLNNLKNCDSCHADPHKGGMTQSCDSCHSPEGWSFTSRAFHKAGHFPLEGRHLSVPCASCHLDGLIKGTPTRCYDCHWIRRQDDPYRTRLGNECEECHRPISWTAVLWDHGARTGMPLNGAHRTLNCDACHKDRVFTSGNFDCYACHREDYEETDDPNHLRAGFPTTCELCHLPSHTSWEQASFNHTSIYPLVGVHATQACSSCHKNNVYAGTPRDCYGCHRADYESTRDPNHVAAGFPTTCETCHRPTDASFEQASFNHGAAYPLVGIHATQACSSCHKNNIYAGTPRDCYGCHRTDYESTRDPNHIAAGFPTTCDSCHRPTDTSFNQGRFDHSYFPITTGRHAGNACSACHPDSSNFKVFSCLTCHGQSETNSHHTGVSGYSYNSQACYSCHPQGRA